MGQVFKYPNLVSGTDEWMGWWTPAVGKDNQCRIYATIALPRPLAQDDVVSLSVDLEFDRLDLTAGNAIASLQGTVDGSWKYFNPFTNVVRTARRDLFSSRPGVLDGEIEVANSFHVDSLSYDTNAGSYNQSPVGHSEFEFGFRVNYSGGGRSAFGASWSSSTRKEHRTHGHRQMGRCGLSER